MVEWMWMESIKLVIFLHIYDTRQQEAWLRWLLLKEFGHHLAYTLPKSRRKEERWKDACIIRKHGFWIHDVDVTFISFIVSSSHELYDGSTRRHQALWLLELYSRERGNICSHLLCDVAGVEEGNIDRKSVV